MAIEIVSFPIKNGGSFHSLLLTFTRGLSQHQCMAKLGVPQPKVGPDFLELHLQQSPPRQSMPHGRTPGWSSWLVPNIDCEMRKLVEFWWNLEYLEYPRNHLTSSVQEIFSSNVSPPGPFRQREYKDWGSSITRFEEFFGPQNMNEH
jgi:hypothetical protein